MIFSHIYIQTHTTFDVILFLLMFIQKYIIFIMFKQQPTYLYVTYIQWCMIWCKILYDMKCFGRKRTYQTSKKNEWKNIYCMSCRLEGIVFPWKNKKREKHCNNMWQTTRDLRRCLLEKCHVSAAFIFVYISESVVIIMGCENITYILYR